MADSDIGGLTELTTPADGDFIPIVDVSEAVDGSKNKKITRKNLAGWTFLTTPLTSTAWDGDARSTTSSTLIDLSAVFGVPAGVKAVLVRLVAKDSAALGTAGLYFDLGPSATYHYNVAVYPFGGDVRTTANGIVACNANGDVYFKIIASGAGTMECHIEIWGYFL